MIGIIGGTGLYQIEDFNVVESRKVDTPFGKPSAEVVIGKIGAEKAAFLPRHGTHHQILPSEINYRANIWALKSVGVRRIMSVSAVGSLVQEIAPGELSLPNQYFDLTKGKRAQSFFGDGLVAHISTAEPTCPSLTHKIQETAGGRGFKVHSGTAYACVEGPRLGTRVESFFLKQVGCQLVGMTAVPEAFLAREAQLCYCTIAIATDYDCWLDDPSQHATLDKVLELYKKNLGRVQGILRAVLQDPSELPECSCGKSLEFAVLSQESSLSEEQNRVLQFLRS